MDYKNRKEVDKELTWDLTDRYKSDEEFEKEYKSLKKQIKKITKYENILLKSVDNLYDALEEYYKIISKLSKLYVYSSLKHDEDLSNAKYNLYLNDAYALYNEFIVLSSFICPEILKASKTTINKYLKDKKLEKYRFLIEDVLRNKKHTLNKNEELIISKLSSNDNVFDKINSILINSKLDYGKIEVDGEETIITNSNYQNIMTNKNRKTRKDAYKLVSNKLKEYNDIFGELLIANMKQVSNMASIRGYDSTIEMQLFSSNIPKTVVDNLYKVVHKRLNVYGKYIDLIRKNLGLEELKYYDLKAEFLSSNVTFGVEDAQLLISEATKIYGKEYNDVINLAFKDRWIDYASYKGKKSGAYCTSNFPDTPRILTNFYGKFTDVSAIAHELGHAVNFYLSEKNNYAHNYENDIFVAEVASLTNEIVLSNYVFNNSKDKNLKLAAIYNLIDIIQNNLFSACEEGELENIVYDLIDKNEEVSTDVLCNTIIDLRKKYYGNKVSLDDNLKYMWPRRAHYYYPFYLYQYATGVSAAIMVASKILKENEEFKSKYIEFLKSGMTDYPIDLLKKLGIDMTGEDVFNNAIDYFEYLIDMFNKVSEE